MNELALGIGIAWLGYTIYKVVNENKLLRQANERHEQINELSDEIKANCKEVKRIGDRTEELLEYKLYLIRQGDLYGSELIQSDINKGVKKMEQLNDANDKINDKINEIIFASK